MPQQGFHCIVDFVDVPFRACVECAATQGRCQFTASLLREMAEQSRSRAPDEPSSASVTTLVGCVRQAYLKEAEEFYQRPDEQYWAYRGTIGHTMVERGAGEDVIAERRFARELRLPSGRTLTIAGRPDEVSPGRKLLVEYKTTDRPPKTPSLQHVAQLNAYRWLVAPEHSVERLGIVYLTMRGVEKASVAIWPDVQVERFLAERAAELIQARETGAWPAMTEDTWMCNYCPVAHACKHGPLPEAALHGAPAVDTPDRTTASTFSVDALLLDATVAPDSLALAAAPARGAAPVRMALPVVSAPVPEDVGAEPEPIVEPADLDEWDPAERGELVAAG